MNRMANKMEKHLAKEASKIEQKINYEAKFDLNQLKHSLFDYEQIVVGNNLVNRLTGKSLIKYMKKKYESADDLIKEINESDKWGVIPWLFKGEMRVYLNTFESYKS